MSDKKIILFGIGHEFEQVQLFMVENKIYLKYYDSFYPLNMTYSFEPLRKIQDKNLIAKMGDK